MIGPLTTQDAPYMERLKEKDEGLFSFLEEALELKEDVVVISLGSVCKLKAWSVTAFYKGLDNLGCRVVWSLKDETLNLLNEE